VTEADPGERERRRRRSWCSPGSIRSGIRRSGARRRSWTTWSVEEGPLGASAANGGVEHARSRVQRRGRDASVGERGRERARRTRGKAGGMDERRSYPLDASVPSVASPCRRTTGARTVTTGTTTRGGGRKVRWAGPTWAAGERQVSLALFPFSSVFFYLFNREGKAINWAPISFKKNMGRVPLNP
jgi:hypothetical protein